MPYRLTTFDGVPLPEHVPVDDLGTGFVDSSLIDALGGAVDYLGGARRLPQRQAIQFSGTYLGKTSFLADHNGALILTGANGAGDQLSLGQDVIADLRNQVDNIKAKVGVVGRLYREREDDRLRQWKTARLMRVPHQQRVEHVNKVAELTLDFEARSATWYADEPTVTTDSLTGGVNSVSVTVDGAETVRDPILRFTASGALTNIEILSNNTHLIYDGTLASGRTLIIDAGRMVAYDWNGTLEYLDAYDNLTLPVTHTARGWLQLEPGTNTLQINLPSGEAATLAVEYYDQWS